MFNVQPTFTPSMAPKVQTQVIQVHLVDKTQQQPAIPVPRMLCKYTRVNARSSACMDMELQVQPQPVGITTIQVPPHGAQPNTVNVPLQVPHTQAPVLTYTLPYAWLACTHECGHISVGTASGFR